MKVDDFDFDLPREFIAQRPASPRDTSRLLVVDDDGLADKTFRDLPDLLRAGDILVCNDTRVIPARLKGKRGTAGIEVTLHKRDDDATWRAFARPAKKLSPGDRIDFGEGFAAEVMAKGEAGEVTLTFTCAGPELMAMLTRHGGMPLPPYIKREGLSDDHDREDYQTLFADKDGAVAAPTAGLHFTPEILGAIEAKGVKTIRLTLHVGAGTFLPVKVDDTDNHTMHAEWGEVSEQAAAAINQTKGAGGRLICVGTTSLRLLESAADEDGRVRPFSGDTDIFITPGVPVRTADLLLTNFHLPRSTLFMLVSAFSGLDSMKAAYEHAKRAGYRFFSYGDACLLQRKDTR